MKYIHTYDTIAEFERDYNDDAKYIEPWISYTRENEKTNYNKPVIINFQPYGRFVFADFGITQEKIDTWVSMIDNRAPLEDFDVLVLSNPHVYVSHDNNYIYFVDASDNVAQIGIHNDYIEIYRAADTK